MVWGAAQGGGQGTKRPGGGATCLGRATSQQAGCSRCLGRKAVVVTSSATQVQLPGHTEDSELPKEREKDMDKRRSYLPWWSDWSPSRPRRLLPWSEGRVVGHLTCHASAAARPQHRQLHRHHSQLSSCPTLSFLHNDLETKGKAN